MQNNSFNLRIPFEHPFVKKKRNRQNTESLIYYLYVHDCTPASECIWVSSPRTRLRNTAGQAMLIRGSARSLINMSAQTYTVMVKGRISELIIKTKTKSQVKTQILQNLNSIAISFQKHFTI